MQTMIIDDGLVSLTVRYHTDFLNETSISSVYDNKNGRLASRRLCIYAGDIINLKIEKV